MFLNKLVLHCLTIVTPQNHLRPLSTTPLLKQTVLWFRTTTSMTTKPNLLKPPVEVTGLKTLDKRLFDKPVKLPCVKTNIKPSSVLPHLKKFLLKMNNIKPVQHINDSETQIYLNPEMVGRWEDLGPDVTSRLEELSLNESNFQLCDYTLGYDNFSVESVLKAVLPPHLEGSSSFTKVGHIVHVNLREHLLDYKELIGEVLYDKVPNCKTVVNKASIIDNTYRNFSMEVLRGDDNMITSLKENKCTFEFDFSKVYWNSRLSTEHERIVNMIQTGDVVFDVFAGVGPFSVPLAKKKCQVFANDLNPESHKWLEHNSRKNKVDSDFFKSYNKDGRDFINQEIKSMLPQFVDKNVFILMNLPAIAVEFLDSFVGLYDYNELGEIRNPPTVVVYCFAKGDDYNSIARNLLFQHIGRNISDKIVEIFRVRSVSNLKEMMRVVFKLDRDILVKGGKRGGTDDCKDTGAKKCKYGQEQEED